MRWLWTALVVVGCNSAPSSPIIPGTVGWRENWPVRVQQVNKVDLLFVVDNSPSMADAQAELARSVPSLLATLTDHAKDPDTDRDRDPIDIHVGVITSSLGSHGTGICDPTTNPHMNDHGHLLPRDGEPCGVGVATSSAIRWTYTPQKDTPFVGSEGATKLEAATACVVHSAHDDGCSYQETWESAYHFLVDPKPYASANVKCTFEDTGDACGSNKIEVVGVDEELLAERKAFLRQDSLLAVVILSNENDVSLKPAGLNWLPWGYGKGQMQRGWTDCSKVPDDFEPEIKTEYDVLHSMYDCKSCFEDGSDPNCKNPWPLSANQDVDDRNLRGFEQTRRFGYNFLWGRQRYVQAFTNAQAIASDGSLGVNPVFAGGFRTTDLVIVQAIVGVPDRLVNLPKELGDTDWKEIIGPPAERDPHMIESIAPRAGIPRFAGDRAVDAVNGGDRDIPAGSELQYACIRKRAVAKHSNACKLPGSDLRDPLCDGALQTHVGAFPGLRHLRIVHDLGASGLVASICNESLVPAMTALGQKITDALSLECISADVGVKNGRATCAMFEVMPDDGGGATCEQLGKGLCTLGAAPCRVEAVPLATAAANLTLPINVVEPTTGLASNESVTATVDGANAIMEGSDHRRHLVCEILQLTDPDPNATKCRSDKKFVLDPTVAGGWCYTTDPAVLSKGCTLGTLRFGGGALPREGAEIFPLCSSE